MNWNEHIGKEYIFTAEYHLHQQGKMLVLDVRRQDGELLREHLLIPFTRRFKKKFLRRGDVVRLRGKVNRYFKKHPAHRNKARHPRYLICQFQLTNIHILKIERVEELGYDYE